jgi:hypothetical protein
MPLIDPAKKAVRVARRKERRAKIVSLIKWLVEEFDDLTDEIAEDVKDFLDGPGAPEQPEDLNPTDKIG